MSPQGKNDSIMSKENKRTNLKHIMNSITPVGG